MEELGNLILGVCCKVEFEDGSWHGMVDSLTSFVFFSCEYKPVNLSLSFPF
jgi:hypothetical protein